MRPTHRIFALAAALAFFGIHASAQQPLRDKVTVANAQSDTTRGMYNKDGTAKKGRHHMNDSTRAKTMRRGDNRDTTHMHTAPDNTRRNKRDTTKTHLTPMDQGSKSEDVEMTRKIRAEIMKLDGMSMNARNIKIITVDGHVTLRGPVNSEAEKQRITDAVEKIAPSGKVDNQLEVKQSEE
jgi:hyperosmotically inducible periplasmic protein